MCGAVCEMLQGMEGGWVVIEASHTVTCHVWGQLVNLAGHGGRLGGYRGLTHDGLWVEFNI